MSHSISKKENKIGEARKSPSEALDSRHTTDNKHDVSKYNNSKHDVSKSYIKSLVVTNVIISTTLAHT